MLISFWNNIKLVNRVSYLINAIVIIILLWCIIKYIIIDRFIIEDVLVSSNGNHVTQQQVNYVAQSKLRESIFMVDIDKLHYNFMQIPWVKEVFISRIFPNKLKIDLVEYKAIARFSDSGFISDTGEIFDGADDRNLLPTFYLNASQTHAGIELYKKILPIVVARNLDIVNLKFDGAVTQLFLSDGEKIVLCNNEFESSLNKLNLYWNRLKIVNPNLKLINFCYKNYVAINLPVQVRKVGVR